MAMNEHGLARIGRTGFADLDLIHCLGPQPRDETYARRRLDAPPAYGGALEEPEPSWRRGTQTCNF